MEKCISDRVWIYAENIIKNLGITDEHFLRVSKEIYKNLRVDGAFIDKNPKTNARAFVYMVNLLAGKEKTQMNVCEADGVNYSKLLSLRANFHRLQKIIDEDRVEYIEMFHELD